MTVPSSAAEPGSIEYGDSSSLLCALQEVFMTTAGTLLSAGESFFTALLSGRHENVTDSSGALFIDSEGWRGEVVV